MSKKSFKEILKKERERRGWTQKDLADKIQANERTVSRWEGGSNKPTSFLQQQLCDLFAMSREELGLLSMEKAFVILLSYAQEDKSFAECLKSDLENHGLVFCDDNEVQFSKDEVQALILIASLHSCLDQSVKEKLDFAVLNGCPVHIVWISGKRRKFVFPPQSGLQAIDAIDARGEKYKLAISRLHTNLQQQMHASSNNKSLIQDPRNPYKGLRAFHSEDAHDFFGRTQLIEDMADQLEQLLSSSEREEPSERFLTLLGPSGSGKSSALLAGLLPLLQTDEFPGSKNWIYLHPITPGKHPIEALAMTLGWAFSASLTSINEDLKAEDSRGLHILAERLISQQGQKVVLVVDQFEELFTQTADEQERKHFISLLVTASTEKKGSVIVLCTLRADFYDRPMYYPELCSIIEHHHISVLPMNTHELKAAIKYPASQSDVQLNFDEQLVEEIIFELQGQTGTLPLLQFMLEQLFKKRSGHLLTFDAYRELGGVRGSLSKHAEKTYHTLTTNEHRHFARLLFIRLIDVEPIKQEVTRRCTPLSEFVSGNVVQDRSMQETIDIFVTARLLTANQIGDITTIEISHEALIREWERYSSWLQENRKDIYLQQNIRRDVEAWENEGKRKERLYRGFQLAEVNEWSRRNTPSHIEQRFIKVSITQQRRTRISILMTALLSVILLLPFVGSWLGFHIAFIDPVKPGGWWYSPNTNEIVHDELHLIAAAYPNTPVSPAISYVNFTMRWPGNDPWITVCHLTHHTTNNLFQCTVNLHKLRASPGQIGVSFDVYDQQGNVIQAPNGVRHIFYIPSPKE